MTADTDLVEVEDDERQIELDTIAAIFPELVLDPSDHFAASIDIPVIPSAPVPVSFPESSDGGPPDAVANETQNLSHLPSLHLRIVLPVGYPSTIAPVFRLSTAPAWLAQDVTLRLENEGLEMWEEFGHDQVVFAYLDHLQQAAENAFGLLEHSSYLEISQDHKISLLDYDIKAKRAAFEKETFDCGICLDPKKGTVCHRMLDCGHVFCRQCLQDFYNNAITEGDLTSIRCLTPDCAKKRAAAPISPGKRRKTKTNLSPSELLQIPIGHEMVKRYVRLKHKVELESDKNTVYCPRKWCQGAARTKKHRKPEDFETAESSDEDSADESGSSDKQKLYTQDELLCICEDCSFAFCKRCFQGWHGVDLSKCMPRQANGELTEEDKASLKYLEIYSTACPTCGVPSQKTHGCNHMICFRCNSHFCYLCCAWLDPQNPYKHFNNAAMPCHMRLWELEEGDGEGLPQRRAPHGEFAVEQEEIEDEGGDLEAEDDEGAHLVDEGEFRAAIGEPPVQEEHGVRQIDRADRNAQRPAQAVVAVAAEPIQMAREGPLVLRLEVPVGVPPPVPEAPPAVPAAAQNRGGGAHRGRGGFRGAARGVGQGAGRGGGNGAAAGQNIPAAGLIVRGQNNNRQPILPEQREWIQRFVNMALNDEEDQMEWDSGDDEDWDIPLAH